MARTALILILIVTLAALVGCATYTHAPAPLITGDVVVQGSGPDPTRCAWTYKAGKLVEESCAGTDFR